MDITPTIIAGIVYPGLITVLALGLLYRWLVGSAADRAGAGGIGVAIRSREGLATLAGVLAAAAGLATMPWPLHPTGVAHTWLWSWAGFELAFLAPLAPALAAGVPRVVRAAARRAQIGTFGRALLWMALAASLAIHAEWRLAALPAHLLAIVAAIIAFPIAVGWGPFDDEVSITGAGVQAGLPPALRWLDGMARDMASGALLAAALVATLPITIGPLWLGPILIAAGFIIVGALLHQLGGRMPRLALPAILRLGWVYVAPLAAAAAVALIIAGRLR
jgi:hypothetical protein